MPETLQQPMRLRLLACEVLYRECCHLVASTPHTVDMEFVAKGLHDLGADSMRPRLQEAVDRVPEKTYAAILLGYGLCNNGIAGLAARHTQIVIPRAHDCITLFLGSRQKYEDYFYAHPGVYFKTSGWVERGGISDQLMPQTVQHRMGMDRTYQELLDKYGEDNARYLYSLLCDTTRNYSQFTFIEMGIEPDGRFEQQTRREAEERGWRFEKVRGDLRLLRKLIYGEWDPDEFLVVPPGHRITAVLGNDIIALEELSL